MAWNRGVYLNGRNAYIEILNSENLNFNELTIFFRFKARQTYPWRYILAKATGSPFTNGWQGWRFNTGINGSVLNFDLSESSTNYIRLYSATTIANNQWHEVIGWWDGSDAELWIDGSLKDSGSFSGDITNTLPITIGATSDYAANTQCIFDELLIWNRALTDNEKEQLWQGKIPQDGLVLWIPFTENAGVVCKDYASGLYGRMYNCRWVCQQRRGMYFDNGGINFNVNINVDCNYTTGVVVFMINTLEKGGIALSGRNCILHIGGDKLMLFNAQFDRRIRTTNYDGTWKEIMSNVNLEDGKVYVAAGIQNGNEEHIYLASNGVIIDHSYRTDIGIVTPYTGVDVQVGSNIEGNYALHGVVLAAMIYSRPLTEDEIKYISDGGWLDPPRDGLISWILFDKKKEGDVVIDEKTEAQGQYIGTPKFVVRKPLR